MWSRLSQGTAPGPAEFGESPRTQSLRVPSHPREPPEPHRSSLEGSEGSSATSVLLQEPREGDTIPCKGPGEDRAPQVYPSHGA